MTDVSPLGRVAQTPGYTMLRAVHDLARHSGSFHVQAICAATLGVATTLAGCSFCSPQHAKKPPESADSSSVHFVGRVAVEPSGMVMYAWSGAGFIARFRGTGAAIRLDDDKNEHQAVLDGRALPKIVSSKGTERYLVAEGLTLGEHRLEVYRRTEALFGVTRFLGVEVVGGQLLDVGEVPRRHIELVGDSISCGYGNEGQNTDCRFSADTENHYLSYGAVLARELGAELSTVAWSGRGVVRNYDGGPGEKLEQLYQCVLPESPSVPWTPTLANDVVIVNVGTNDFSTEPVPSAAEFVRGYAALLERIRKNNPSAFVLCTIGPMLGGQDLERAEVGIESAVEQRRTAGDARMTVHRMKTRNENPGCDWHPSLATHRRMADELAQPIKAALGW